MNVRKLELNGKWLWNKIWKFFVVFVAVSSLSSSVTALRRGNIGKVDEEPGYAEGGVILKPNVFTSTNHRKHTVDDDNAGPTDLLDAMLGFARKERLDVKKPGPPAAIPLEDHPAINATKAQVNGTTESSKLSILPRIKRIFHLETDDEHAPHSVDTEFVHIIVKNPMNSWTDGIRVLAAIADTLNMKDLLTSVRVYRHEIAFRVEPNPNKIASDVVRAINDVRFMTNFQRRFGVNVLQAGEGNKTKSSVSKEPADRSWSSVILNEAQSNEQT